MTREGQIDLNEAVQHPGKKLVFQVNTGLEQEEDIDLLEPVIGELHVVSTGNLLLVEAEFKTKACFECARCATPLELPIEFHMSEAFQVDGVPSAYARDGFAKVVEDEPEPIFNENSLILDHFVRQGLVINLPQQPLCSGSWEVPCPNSLTEGQGKAEEGHPAFQSLSKFKAEKG